MQGTLSLSLVMAPYADQIEFPLEASTFSDCVRHADLQPHHLLRPKSKNETATFIPIGTFVRLHPWVGTKLNFTNEMETYLSQ